MGSQAGRRKATASPTSSAAPSPTPLRLKLSIRSQSQPSSPKTATQSLSHSTSSLPSTSSHAASSSSSAAALAKSRGRPRKQAASQRPNFATIYAADSDSDLTPDEDGSGSYGHVNGLGMDMDTAAAAAPQKRKVGRPRNSDKGKDRATVPQAKSATPSKAEGSAHAQVSSSKKGKEKASDKVTVSGPAGRDRKRSIKNDQAERRRQRDAKFDADTGNYGASSSKRKLDEDETDAASSFGDDESDHDLDSHLAQPKTVFSGLGDETEDEGHHMLPEAFAGHEIEDLAYGAGYYDYDYDIEREALGGWWGEEEDEEETEDEARLIAKLSGSEAEQDSQSSADESEEVASSSSSESDTEPELDEYGYPLPLSHDPGTGPGEEAGLVLMENWDGQFVLVQPRAERSSKKRRGSKGSKGSKGSRTNGSVAGSTIAPSEQPDGEMALVIDADAIGHEFDSYESSEWSGVSDEDDDGGDTTDSMAEEDMPMLDSPAMDDLIQQQIGLPVPSPPQDWFDEAFTASAVSGVGAPGGLDGSEGVDGMDGLEGLEGVEGMEGMEAMLNIEELAGVGMVPMDDMGVPGSHGSEGIMNGAGVEGLESGIPVGMDLANINMDMGIGMDLSMGLDMDIDLAQAFENVQNQQGAPSIIITDTTVPETPALSTASDGTPNMAYPLPGPPTGSFDFAAPPLPVQLPTSVTSPGFASAPVSPSATSNGFAMPMHGSMYGAPDMSSTLSNATAPPLAPVPMMGTFLPRSSDPAQHAVIDGSGASTVSPFTHRRRSRKQRAGSMSSMGGRSARSTTAGLGTPGPSVEERKRKVKSGSIASFNGDPFSPSGSLSSRSKSANPMSSAAKAKAHAHAHALLAKKAARYSSIPGHPRYLAAQREAVEAEERDRTPSDDDAMSGAGMNGMMGRQMGMGMDIDMDMDMQFDLDDMLDTGMFTHALPGDANNTDGTGIAYDADGNPVNLAADPQSAEAAEHMRHMLRFGRVPVSTYMQRNIVGDKRHQHKHQQQHSTQNQTPTKSFSNGQGHSRSQSDVVLGDTYHARHAAAQNVTLTPAQERFAISPLFGPERDEERRGRVPGLRL